VNHFTLDEGQPASAGLLIEEPGWTPYCLDDENQRVLFVYTPARLDLSQAAFVYSAQFEQAQRALVVPYTALNAVTATLKAPDTMIFVYSIGRCGSTLMSRILNQINGMYSLSEPDIFTGLSYLRKTDPSRDRELTQILHACSLLLSQRSNGIRPSMVALKFRSHGIGLADLLYKAFPNGHNIFMYRQAQSWAQSVFRFLQRLNFANDLSPTEAVSLWHRLTGEEADYVEPYIDLQAETVSFSDLLAPAWTSYFDRYMLQVERGVPFYPLRYEDLNDHRGSPLQAMFDYCDLPSAAVEQAMQGFETDSQAGTDIARDIRADNLTPEQIERFLEVLSRHRRFNQPDLLLPPNRRDAKGAM
jgi:hypothetical protein